MGIFSTSRADARQRARKREKNTEETLCVITTASWSESDCALFVDKPVGWTPLQCCQFLKRCYGDEQRKLSYAGRLDPMASGLLVLLSGEENKRQPQWLQHSKRYEFEVLLGATSDSFDLLGLAEVQQPPPQMPPLQPLLGRRRQPYPPYSSRPFKGQPLWKWAREGRLEEVQPWPSVEVEFSRLEVRGEQRRLTGVQLLQEVRQRLSLVRNREDLRADEVTRRWEEVLQEHHEFLVVPLLATCTSGGYVRGICHALGGLAFSIRRVALGPYTLDNVELFRFDDPEHAYQRGMREFQAGEHVAAYASFREGCRLSNYQHGPSYYRMERMNREHLGVDATLLVELRGEARGGDVDAILWMGDALMYGRGVLRNKEEAARYFRLALPHPHALFRLERSGEASAARHVSALVAMDRLQMASRQRYPPAMVQLGQVMAEMRLWPRAFPLFRDAAALGHPEGHAQMQRLLLEQAEQVAPYGNWAPGRPDSFRFLPEHCRKAIRCWLLVNYRLAVLPRELVYRVVFWIATKTET